MATNTITSRDNLLAAAQMTHNNEIITVANVLDEVNPFVQDAPMQEAIDITSHVIARTTSLPSATFIKVGNGWDAGLGTYSQARESMAMIRARYQCPEEVMNLQPSAGAYRMQRERDQVEGMSQVFANQMISGSTITTPERFNGLELRYGALGTARTNYVISNGGSNSGYHTSIWFVQWSPSKCYLIYPRGSKNVGIQKRDEGRVFTTGDDSKSMWAYVTEFAWDVGLCVEDTRSVKRLCNIDTASGSASSIDEDKIIQILNNFRGNEQIIMYCNEDLKTQLDILAKDKGNVQYLPDSPWGKGVLSFRGVPIKVCDAITSTEGTIS
jgi:hypothetical protein